MKKTAILLIGFGGPEKSSEIRPFLDSVLEGVKIPPARYEAVVHHYEAVGGASPYNAITRRQKDALAAELKKRGADFPVYAGFRHSSPSFADVFRELKQKGFERVVGFVLSSLRSYPSFEKYCERVERGRKEADAEGIEIVYAGDFHQHPLFIEAQAAKIKKIDGAFYLFSAHSIPVEWSEKSGYARQFERASALIAEKLGIKDWSVCYQSRSGNPRDPWLVPDVCDAIAAVDRSRFRELVVTPSGFLSDNVEVLYDIDIEAKNKAVECGFHFTRPETVMDHPSFIRLMADQVQACLK
jgi:ferrochelatase